MTIESIHCEPSVVVSPYGCKKSNPQASKAESSGRSGRTMSNSSLGTVTKRHSQIPVSSRFQSNLHKSTPKKAEPKSPKISSTVRKPSTAKSAKPSPKSTKGCGGLRSPSPKRVQRRIPRRLDGRCKSASTRTEEEAAEAAAADDCSLSATESTATGGGDLDGSVSCKKSDMTVTLSSPRTGAPETPGSSADQKEPASSAASETSLDYDFDLVPCALPATPHDSVKALDISDIDADEESAMDTPPRDSPRKTSSNESGAKGTPPRTTQTTIRTLSGDEIVFSSSMEFDIEVVKDDDDDDEDDDLARLLREDEGKWFAEEEEEGDREGEEKAEEPEPEPLPMPPPPPPPPPTTTTTTTAAEPRTTWRNRENELLTDVGYRQSVYHPTVLRRQEEFQEERERPRSKSIEDRCSSYLVNGSDRDKAARVKNSFKKKNLSQTFVSNRDVNINPLRPWSEKGPQSEDLHMYDRLNLIQNPDYVLKEVKRERSKKERIAGAVLRFTAKVIHLLAILNLWPGDNCQLLSYHSLQYGR